MSKESSYKSDKELDDLLRKIADSAEIPFSKEDWGDMKARLDELPNPAPVGWMKKNRVWVGSFILGLLLLSVAVWHSLPVGQDGDPFTTGPETVSVPIGSKEEKVEDSELSEKAGIGATEDPIGIDPSEVEESTGIIGASSTDSASTVAPEKTAMNSAGLDSGTPGNAVWKESKNFPIQSQHNSIPPLDLKAFKFGSPDFSSRYSIPAGPVERERKSYGFAGRFSLSVQAAPDLSGIKMNQVEKAGNALGIGAAYFLSPRLSIASGVFYSFKPYGTAGEANYGSTDEPDWIFGECDILDIPVNLRYYPVEGKLQRAFISVGLSSYLMLKEHYELVYEDDGTGYPYTREINVSGENNHLFGVVNFSAGYERKVGKQLGIQVEPYFKVPVSGVGEGDISLKSTGLFVGLNFYPGR